jgi:hypothetical protein
MNVFDKHQINIAKKTLKLSDVGASILGGLTKPEAMLMLKQNGMSVTEITNLLVKNGHSTKEIQDLFIQCFRIR